MEIILIFQDIKPQIKLSSQTNLDRLADHHNYPKALTN